MEIISEKKKTMEAKLNEEVLNAVAHREVGLLIFRGFNNKKVNFVNFVITSQFGRATLQKRALRKRGKNKSSSSPLLAPTI